jgi:alkylated DNA nucleotide flippase Atl1
VTPSGYHGKKQNLPTTGRRRWRADSEMGPGPRRPLTHDQRRQWIAQAWRLKSQGEISGNELTLALTMARMQGANGRLDPSYSTLAAWTGLCERTVQRCMARLRQVQLLSWVRRMVRRGPRAEQTSNAYSLTATAETAENRQPRSKRQMVAETLKKVFTKAIDAPVIPKSGDEIDRSAAIDALARVREARHRTLLGRTRT